MSRPSSLRRRLLVNLLGGYLLFALAISALVYRHTHHEIDELFDEQLRQVAFSLLAQADEHDDDEEGDGGQSRHLDDQRHHRYAFEIRDHSGRVHARSGDLPIAAPGNGEGYAESENDRAHWRYYAQWDDHHRHQVVVGEDHARREQLARASALRVLLPLLLGLPLLGLWVWLATGRGLAPLTRLTHQLEQRGARQLAQLQSDGAPTEVTPLVDEINRLLGEVDHALAAERRFTADAAHELRTPLAALQTQAQVALRARNDEEREHALNGLRTGLERAVRLVEQMLQLAHLDPEKGLQNRVSVDLAQLAEDICADMGSLALRKRIDFSLDTTPATAAGHPDWLRVLLRNLVDNALRYTPEQGHVEVRVMMLDGMPVFEVSDNGPGIPSDQRAAALRRFYRLQQGCGEKGSGLGLSIVSRIAELHGARLELGSPVDGRGLRVRVLFPVTSFDQGS
jgi:two-component system, OmpR family, sensor histidine kinase QseC